MSAPTAVLVGFIAKLPYGGMALYNLHYLVGLLELGYDVHYVERVNTPYECYDPSTDTSGDDVTYGVRYLHERLAAIGLRPEQSSVIGHDGRCHGAGWDELSAVLGRADFVLTIADLTWFDELAACDRRLFVDGDPVFTQAGVLESASDAERLAGYDTLFTYATRLGQPDCLVPDAGRSWLPTTPVVATSVWPEPSPPSADAPVTALLHWKAAKGVVLDGQEFGHKDRQFAMYADLPRRLGRRCRLAVGGNAPRDELADRGWELADPLASTLELTDYRRFIDASVADFGVAKHAYVASRSGWFSDRSLCFMAAGRPVLHEDTGFTDWLPGEKGVVAFTDLDTAVDAASRVLADAAGHGREARRLACEVFEARTVVGDMLDRAGLR